MKLLTSLPYVSSILIYKVQEIRTMSSTKYIIFHQLREDSIIPKRATEQSAGFDLYARESVTVTGGNGNVVVDTGISVLLPEGTYARIACRSGLAVREHLNTSAGVIDRDYTGSIGIVLSCSKNGHSYTVQKGERVAQLIVERIVTDTITEAEALLHVKGVVSRLTSEQLVAVTDQVIVGGDSIHTAVNKIHTGFGSTGKF